MRVSRYLSFIGFTLLGLLWYYVQTDPFGYLREYETLHATCRVASSKTIAALTSPACMDSSWITAFHALAALPVFLTIWYCALTEEVKARNASVR